MTLHETLKKNNVTAGINQTITIESTVENTSDKQDDFAGNSYSITLTPKSGTQGFSCGIGNFEEAIIGPTVNLTYTFSILNGNIVAGTYAVDAYCINNSPTDASSCGWINYTGDIEYGCIYHDYNDNEIAYAHVRDVDGNIFHSDNIGFFSGDVCVK